MLKAILSWPQFRGTVTAVWACGVTIAPVLTYLGGKYAWLRQAQPQSLEYCVIEDVTQLRGDEANTGCKYNKLFVVAFYNRGDVLSKDYADLPISIVLWDKTGKKILADSYYFSRNYASGFNFLAMEAAGNHPVNQRCFAFVVKNASRDKLKSFFEVEMVVGCNDPDPDLTVECAQGGIVMRQVLPKDVGREVLHEGNESPPYYKGDTLKS